MQTRTLGRNGPTVSALGLGCMGMSEFYGAHDDGESLATLHRALERGVNFLDTADIYGPYTNEELVGRALRGRRDAAFLATKFGFVRDANPAARIIDGRPERVPQACEASLKRLQVAHIDLYYLHRVDPNVPIEDTVGAMAQLVRAGQVRHLGLSEVAPQTLERAHRVHRITALQSEYSLWTRDPEDGVLEACERLGIGFVRDANNPAARAIDGRPEYVRAACEGSLRRLNVAHIDLYYLHRADRSVPIEDTVGAMAELVRAGKVRYLGLSEVSPQTLERAHRVHRITALQSEYSLWTRDPEDGALAACERLGVGLVAYSPLGRGFLTGALKTPDDFAADDYRRSNPRFQGENFRRNLALVEKVKALAHEKGCTPGQLALAWVLAQGPQIVPIPGTRRIHNLDENLGALEVSLSPKELAAIEAVFPPSAVAGARYGEEMMRLVRG